MSDKCQQKTEVYSRVCGFFRPVQQWNRGKQEEFQQRREYRLDSERGQR
ncbi:MAG: anaerobic ribonucleoside-triphosphate reductase [Desulfuromonas thiophila]|jgi:ribonucleoside-triphosphate reductase|uniref:Anaerobic ribonucleoside-triphosphate reductase n=1 Tax=Desulfuromonas thiophila TaxID=57664 RepID=A0A1G6XQH8_9BACT|nr:anaerobic ribonucleoside-triphosphate reductase [Desulfuromonas thiophila]MDD3801127.1 anaerobic ribonucleoside-triphosphate reductase [Desulfuromonas thiophila]SDD79627.1 Anaerobic ribonucleoside-triphosphate reductase [Desulfuromonas thiophila]